MFEKGDLDSFKDTNRFKEHKDYRRYFGWIYRFFSLYSAHCLIGSRLIESAEYCNQILLVPLYLNSTQNASVNWIILSWPKVILLSGGHCIPRLSSCMIGNSGLRNTKTHVKACFCDIFISICVILHFTMLVLNILRQILLVFFCY